MARYDDRPARRRNSRDYDDRAPAPRRSSRDDYDDRDDRREPPPRGNSRGSIIVLDGDRGDDFLDRLFGAGASDEEYDDEDLDDDNEDDDAPQDPPARNGHRFFGGR